MEGTKRFEEHARITQGLKDFMKQAPGWKNLRSVHRESLDMIAHKIGRILNGNPDLPDSWHDIAGYAELVVREVSGEAEMERQTKRMEDHISNTYLSLR